MNTKCTTGKTKGQFHKWAVFYREFGDGSFESTVRCLKCGEILAYRPEADREGEKIRALAGGR